ncbi:hypothetical protein F4808DRAFT_425794 [Astrocystis sublimbata]|nr:hypothetical protein F4808DRAFT_425794 [Astrocystis sublimbata]
MVALRLNNTLSALRATTRTRSLQGQPRTFFAVPSFRAQGYGDGKGDPVAENPQKQPASNKTKEASEHPGPKAPNVGSAEEQASAQSGGSRSKDAVESGDVQSGNGTAAGGEGLKGPQGKEAPKPKVKNQSVSVSSGLTDEQKKEVETHNLEFENKHDRSGTAPADKVDKKFWKGTGGRDTSGNDWNA